MTRRTYLAVGFISFCLFAAGALIIAGQTYGRPPVPPHVFKAVRAYWKTRPERVKAFDVISCETGGTYSIWAQNGQYENLFQMGYSERRTYGWHVAGSPARLAARAAHRYWAASGRDWSPWSCQPRSGS